MGRTFQFRRNLYKQFGWVGLLPIPVGVWFLTFKWVVETRGWSSLGSYVVAFLFKWKAAEAKDLLRLILNVAGRILLLGFLAWVAINLKPYAMEYGAKFVDGVVFRAPYWDLPPVTWDTLFTMPTFLHYGWMFLALACLVDLGIKEFVKAVFWLAVLGVLGMWVYATYINYWPPGTTTDDLFWFGKWFPVVMPMDTFWNDAGVMILIVTVYGVFEHLKYSAIADAQKQEAAKVPSGALPTMNEATSDELEKGGHL